MLAAAALLASCSQDDALQNTLNGNEGLAPITISVATPDGMATRANAGGDEEVTRCLIQILDENSQPMEGYETPATMAGTEASGFTKTVMLNPAKTHRILFWADRGADYYTTAYGLDQVTMANDLQTPDIAYAAVTTWGGTETSTVITAELKHVVSKITLRTTTAVSQGKTLSIHVPTTYTGYNVNYERPINRTSNGSTYSMTLPAAVAANSDVFSFYVLADGEENQTLTLNNDGAEKKQENVPVKPDTHIILQGDVQQAGYAQVAFTANVNGAWGGTEIFREPEVGDGYTIDFATHTITLSGAELTEEMVNKALNGTGILVINGEIESSEMYNAINGNNQITELTLNDVTRIEDEALGGLFNLTSLTLPKVTYLGTYAFGGSGLLRSVSLTAAEPITVASNAFQAPTAHNFITLTLNANKRNEVNGNVWQGINWFNIIFA